jgi:signal peptidase II
MSTSKRKTAYLIFFTGVIVFLDEFIKKNVVDWYSEKEISAIPNVLSISVHKNYGIAFDIPFKLPVVILLTVAIILVLLNVAIKNWSKYQSLTLASGMIILGALGNLFDRIYYGFTVDYLIFFERSAINLSDIIIVTGVVLFFFSGKRLKVRHKHIA